MKFSGLVPRYLSEDRLKKYFGTIALVVLSTSLALGQAITASIQGRVFDRTGAVVPNAAITAVNIETGFSRSAKADSSGEYEISQLPVGHYRATAEANTFQTLSHTLQLVIGQVAALDFSLSPASVKEDIVVTTELPLVETTRTSVDSVIGTQQIQNLPVNGRQFIDFALLAPGVIIGDTTSGSTDVIIDPVTKLSFAGQNIHYNFITLVGSANISIPYAVQKYTPTLITFLTFR